MPLIDNEFTQGKGGYKILQYMAMGLPAVASPVGVNAEILLDKQTGFLCKNDQEWFEALKRLIDDVPLRESMGRAGRDRASDKYSYEANTPHLLTALKMLVKQ
jgi:glycosyltransferase involved in cell wall biosynthesis